MKRERPRRRGVLLTMAAAICGAAGLAAPLLVGDVDPDLGLHAAAVLAATHDSFTITAPLALPAVPQLVIERGLVRLDGADTAAARWAALTSGKASLVLENATLVLAPARQAGGPQAEEGVLAPLVAALLQSSFSNLAIANATVRLVGSDGSVIDLEDVSAKLVHERAGRTRVEGTFHLRGRAVKVDMTLRPAEDRTLKEMATVVRGWPIDLRLVADMFQMSADGIVSSNNEGLQLLASSATLSMKDLRQAARWLGAEWPEGPGLAAFAAEGPLELTPRGISFLDATFRMDGNEATGALAFKLWGERPAFDGTLAFGKLDLTPYYAVSPAADDASRANADAGAAGTGHAMARLLPPVGRVSTLRILDQVDADLRISAARVTAPGFAFGKSAASLSLKDGTMLADIAELELDSGGRCGGQLSIAGKGHDQRMALRGKIESIDIALVTRTLWGYPVVSGIGSLTVDLTASGRGAEAIGRTLAGKASVTVPEAGELGLDVKTLAATARAAPQTGWGAALRARTAVDSLSAEINIADGRLFSQQVTAKAGDMVFEVVGSVDLTSRTADLSLAIDHVAAAAAGNADGANGGAGPAAATATGPAASSGAAAPERKSAGTIVIAGPIQSPLVHFKTLERLPAGATVPDTAVPSPGPLFPPASAQPAPAHPAPAQPPR